MDLKKSLLITKINFNLSGTVSVAEALEYLEGMYSLDNIKENIELFLVYANVGDYRIYADLDKSKLRTVENEDGEEELILNKKNFKKIMTKLMMDLNHMLASGYDEENIYIQYKDDKELFVLTKHSKINGQEEYDLTELEWEDDEEVEYDEDDDLLEGKETNKDEEDDEDEWIEIDNPEFYDDDEDLDQDHHGDDEQLEDTDRDTEDLEDETEVVGEKTKKKDNKYFSSNVNDFVNGESQRSIVEDEMEMLHSKEVLTEEETVKWYRGRKIMAIGAIAVCFSVLAYFGFVDKGNNNSKIPDSEFGNLVKLMYQYSDFDKLAKNNIQLLKVLKEDAYVKADITDTDLYKQKYGEFKGLPTKVEVLNIKRNENTVEVKFMVVLTVEAPSYRTIEFILNEKGQIVDLNEYRLVEVI